MSDSFETLDRYEYSGVMHIHTKLSDGTGDIYSISKAAKKVGLDWIIITDHNCFNIEEGIYNGVYVFKGEEVSPKSSNHYLAIGINRLIEPSENVKENIENVRKAGGFGFAAHPDESAVRKNKWKPIIWENKENIPDGIEIWNWFSNWGDNLDDRNIFSTAYSYFCKNKIISNPAEATLNWWDDLNKKSPKIVPGIGGVDAHALKFYRYILPVTVFPYKTCFETITNVITLKEPLSQAFDIAKNQVFTALKQGNNLVINKKVCNIIPQIHISNSNNFAKYGDFIKLDDNTSLNIHAQELTEVKVLHNGNVIYNQKTKCCRIPITQIGKYRIELFYNNKGYAYTNPIQVI